MSVNYDDFMNRAIWMPVINSGKSSVSDQQDKIVDQAYKDAFALLSNAVERSDKLSFERVYWAVSYFIMPIEKAKPSMKHPEMYEKMLDSREQFKAKIEDAKRNNQKFGSYWRSCEKYVR